MFEFTKGINFGDMDDLKQLLKNMNLDYVVDGDAKISTSDIEAKALMNHIEFVIALANENGISFGFVEDEWTRLLNDVGIER